MNDKEFAKSLVAELHHTDPSRWQARIEAALEQVRKDEREVWVQAISRAVVSLREEIQS